MGHPAPTRYANVATRVVEMIDNRLVIDGAIGHRVLFTDKFADIGCTRVTAEAMDYLVAQWTDFKNSPKKVVQE